MKKQIIPEFDSIEEMAKFWDTHDLTDFEDQLVEVKGVFYRPSKPKNLSVSLKPNELKALQKIAKKKGMDSLTLIRRWILERIRKEVAVKK